MTVTLTTTWGSKVSTIALTVRAGAAGAQVTRRAVPVVVRALLPDRVLDAYTPTMMPPVALHHSLPLEQERWVTDGSMMARSLDYGHAAAARGYVPSEHDDGSVIYDHRSA